MASTAVSEQMVERTRLVVAPAPAGTYSSCSRTTRQLVLWHGLKAAAVAKCIMPVAELLAPAFVVSSAKHAESLTHCLTCWSCKHVNTVNFTSCLLNATVCVYFLFVCLSLHACSCCRPLHTAAALCPASPASMCTPARTARAAR
jgi:hypothetical protein